LEDAYLRIRGILHLRAIKQNVHIMTRGDFVPPSPGIRCQPGEDLAIVPVGHVVVDSLPAVKVSFDGVASVVDETASKWLEST
jgi:hypothetical protein